MTGAELIAKERQRQIDKEGWTADHDDQHELEELAKAAAYYAYPPSTHPKKINYLTTFIEFFAWPVHWDLKWDKKDKHDRIKQLIIAGALCAAEIDRFQRKQGHTTQKANRRLMREVIFVRFFVDFFYFIEFLQYHSNRISGALKNFFSRKK